MPGKQSKKRDLDDIQVLGVWNFTIQPDTPLVWLRTGPLDRYLLRYMLAGDGLESKPLATRTYPDPGGEAIEDVELLVQGFTACIFVRNRQVQIRCRTKASRGSICFYNSTKATEDGLREDVHFSNCRITALRRGPLEVGGTLARRERALEPRQEEPAALDPLNADGSVMYEDEEKKDRGLHDSVATTAAPESLGDSMHLTKSGAATTTANFFKTASSPGATRGGFRNTTRGAFGKPGGASAASNSSTMFGGRPGAGPGRLRASLSDSALRKSGSALCGLNPAAQGRGFGDEWVPLAMNPPKSEQAFVREHAIRPLPASRVNACQDFIKM